MLSNHYAFLHGASGNWIVLVIADGRGRADPDVVRGAPSRAACWAGACRGNTRAPVASLLIALGSLAEAVAGPRRDADRFGGGNAMRARSRRSQGIVQERCQPVPQRAATRTRACASTCPTMILAHAAQVYQQAVVLKAMPLNNATRITDAERADAQAVVRSRGPSRTECRARARSASCINCATTASAMISGCLPTMPAQADRDTACGRHALVAHAAVVRADGETARAWTSTRSRRRRPRRRAAAPPRRCGSPAHGRA